MRTQLGWITLFALLALATAGCGSAPGDDGIANEEATANAQTNVGKEESAWRGGFGSPWGSGFGYPIGFGYGAYGAAYGYATGYTTGYAAAYVTPGFLGYPGVYGTCGGFFGGCGGLGLFGWGFKDGRAEAPNIDVARERTQRE